MALHHVAIEGPIGVGKTTVVDRLADRLDGRKLLEDWSSNPFLRAFYEGRPGAAFQTELFFLLSRYRQQQELLQRQLFQATLVDYVFEKSRLFAYLNLDDSELLIYEKLFALLSESVPRPDLIVYLQAPTEVLMRRVKLRGRPEDDQQLSEEYLAEVNRAYNHYFFHYSATPLLVVNTADVDFAHSEADLEDLLKQIRAMGKGTQYYVPRGKA